MAKTTHRPNVAVGGLIAVCLAKGLWLTHDLRSPAMFDTLRDTGFVQGILDGNLLGDPAIAGAYRYYPPLLHAMAAAVIRVTDAEPLPFLIQSAPWLNLAVPLGFFLMARRLIGPPAGAIATVWLVCANGLLLPPWVVATYTPWQSVPMLALALFFIGIILVHARVYTGLRRDAVLLGSAVGVTFLAHTVPAIILAAILATAALATQGLRWRTARWIAIAASVAALWSLPFLLPLLTAYHLHIANLAPGGFTDITFDPWHPGLRLIATTMPILAAAATIGARRGEIPGAAPSRVILVTWLCVPLIFLMRHYACRYTPGAAACTTFVVAVHHWYLYFQAAGTCLIGAAIWWLARAVSPHLPRLTRHAAAVGAAAFCVALFLLRPSDLSMRNRTDQTRIDEETYAWIRAHTTQADVFVTADSADELDREMLTVFAAGRRLVALPAIFSNPYVDWRARDDRRQSYLAALSEGSAPAPANEAEPGGSVYFLLTKTGPAPARGLEPVHSGTQDVLYRLSPLILESATNK
jgi:hypothetical protein